MWPLRIALARLRPVGAPLLFKLLMVSTLFGLFLAGDYAVFRRLFRLAAKIEAATPFFALGLVENFLGLVFLVAMFVLFSSSLTSAIGAFFTDFDLEIYHAAPVSKLRVVVARWAKTLVQSAWVVVAFLVPVFLALASQYSVGTVFLAKATLNLLLLLSVPVSLASLVIINLVRFFPVRRVHQIAASLAIFLVTTVIVGIRLARPERLFAQITTDDVAAVLQAIELPSREVYPSSWLASLLVADTLGSPTMGLQLRMLALAAGAFGLFLAGTLPIYFRAFVRARESSAPTALGAGQVTSLLDRVTRRFDPQVRAMISKEVRVVTRDAAQWSQLFMMIGLLFLYLYNIQMMPLEGDARAAILAYLNLGMAGFVIAAICLRFAYPAISAEGKQFWILQSAPISFRRLLWVKTLVYLCPLLLLAIVLTILANTILAAPPVIWAYTLGGSLLETMTLVTLGVSLGALSPDFKRENPVEVALSLGGFAYMAVSMLYVGLMMFLLARPLQKFILRRLFGFMETPDFIVTALPIIAALLLSAGLILIPMEIGWRRLRRIASS